MTINKYFVFVPQEVTSELPKNQTKAGENETLRQKLLKEAQEKGGL
jgi:hypothetical protein